MDELKLTDSTLVVIFGDNGMALGEVGLFGKDTNFDISSRVPLIFHVPWLAAKGEERKVVRAHDFVQLFDVYPTLGSLLDIPSNEIHSYPVEGADHSHRVALLAQRSPKASSAPATRTAVFSQIYRCPKARCTFAPITAMHRVGYSVRTDLWRYTVYLVSAKGQVDWDQKVAEELYSHEDDDETLFNYDGGVKLETETLNIADQRPDVCAELFEVLKERFSNPLDLLSLSARATVR